MTAVPIPHSVGCTTNGPVLLSDSDNLERKFVVSIVDFDDSKHRNGLACKTTGQHHDNVYPGEFIIDDFFGKGPTKVQPYNVVRIPTSDYESHKHVGDLDPAILPQFERGLRIAIQTNKLNPKEILRVADSWSSLLSF